MNPEQDHDPGLIVQSVVDALHRLGLTERGILAAVSGGPDSLALMHALHRAKVLLEVATIDHRLRPESAAEVELVHEQCVQLGLRFHSRAVTVAPGNGLEAAARDARYAALQAIRAERGLSVIATGHTASDQAETVLMRLGRGSALGGAAGILERRSDGVVRPMLGVTREEALSFVLRQGVPYVDDAMNHDLGFTRVKVRRTVVPALQAALGPQVERALARFARHAAEDDAVLQEQARTALERAVRSDGTIDRVALLSLQRSIARRVTAMVLERAAVPIDSQLIDECLRAVEGKGPATATLPGDLLLTVRDGGVAVESAPPRRAG